MSDRLFDKKWKMKKNLSKFSTARVPETETRLYEKVGDGYKLTVSGTHDGKKYEWGYTAQYDGKPHPVYGRDDVNAIEAYRVNDYITIGFFTQNDMPGGPYTRKLSKDGRSLTVQAAGRNADGTPFFDVIQYEIG
jgi:hypothetical protein